MALYRNTLAVRAQRAEEISQAIEHARQELEALEAEAQGLSARWQDAIAWASAPSPGTRFRRGVGLGLGLVFLLPVLLITFFAGSGLPIAALVCFLR